MTEVTEHDGEQEREGDNCVKARIDFLILGSTIGVDDSLETFRKLVGLVVSWRRLIRLDLIDDGRY